MNSKQFKKWLIQKRACIKGRDFAKGKSLQETYRALEKPQWLIWLIRKLGYEDKKLFVRLAIAAAKTVKQGEAGQRAISAAEEWLSHPNEENRRAAAYAASRAAASRAAAASADDAYSDAAAASAASWAADAPWAPNAADASDAAEAAARAARAASAASWDPNSSYAAYVYTFPSAPNTVYAAYASSSTTANREICDKWREIIGKELVTQTLQNCDKRDNV